jgi:hypothetical protein
MSKCTFAKASCTICTGDASPVENWQGCDLTLHPPPHPSIAKIKNDELYRHSPYSCMTCCWAVKATKQHCNNEIPLFSVFIQRIFSLQADLGTRLFPNSPAKSWKYDRVKSCTDSMESWTLLYVCIKHTLIYLWLEKKQINFFLFSEISNYSKHTFQSLRNNKYESRIGLLAI